MCHCLFSWEQVDVESDWGGTAKEFGTCCTKASHDGVAVVSLAVLAHVESSMRGTLAQVKTR
jgi:hypothetical protein